MEGEFTGLGTSSAMRTLVGRLEELARSPRAPVLLTGEPGTGKRWAARRLHAGGPRARGPLFTINATRLSPTLLASELFGHEKGAFTQALDRRDGVLRHAHGGTLLLEEVTALPVELQPRFLRLLEEGTFRRLGGEVELATDVRILATAHLEHPGELEERVASGAFLPELLRGLEGGRVHLPPVRERDEGDRRKLLDTLLEEVGAEFPGSAPSFHADTVGILLRHSWPGNVREMRNVLERALLGCQGSPLLLPRHFPPELRTPTRAVGAERRRGFQPESLEEVERRHIRLMLEHHGGNRSRSARDLGIARTTLLQKIARYGLEDAGR